MALWSISMFIGVLSNWIYSETAAMFPDKPGGIALYAHEGWRRYFSLVGPVATFGYWFAWSTVLSIFGLIVGGLIVTEWFPGQDWTLDNGPVDVGLGHFIGGGIIILVWIFNIYGVRPAVWVAYATGALLMIPLAVLIVVPYLTGDWDSSNMVWRVSDEGQLWGGWGTALVWLYIMGWSAYGVETCAAFAPEYKDTVRDTSIALRTSALFSLAVYAFLPLGSVGAVGQEAADNAFNSANVADFFVPAFETVVGSGFATDLMVAFLIASLILSMNTATADGSRALYGIARDDMTIKQLFHLNRFRVPARAMTVDMVVNLILLFWVGNVLAILFTGNLGYISAHFFALTGFLLLRKDRPNWPRPIKLATIWLPIAAILALANLSFIIVGASHPSLTFYGGTKETWIGVGVLLFSIALFVFRRLVQDRARIVLREPTPDVPPTVGTPAAGMPAS